MVPRAEAAAGFDRERPKGELVLRLDLDEFDFVEQLVLVELAFDIGQGELRAVDRNFEFGENPGQAADMILMAVRQDDAANAGFVLNKVSDVGDYDIDTQQFRFREH